MNTFTYWSGAAPILRGPHCIIAGATGSGKSVIIAAAIKAITAYDPAEKAFYGIDLKRVELSRYRAFPHCRGIVTEPEKVKAMLEKLNRIMDRRFKEMERAGAVEYAGGALYLIIDELADCMQTVKEAEHLITRIMRLGRAARVFCILATQSPQRSVLTAKIHQNAACKIALRCDTAIESRQIIGIVGAEMLPRYGQALVKVPGSIDRVIVPYTDPEEIAERLECWKRIKHPLYRLFHRHKRRP